MSFLNPVGQSCWSMGIITSVIPSLITLSLISPLVPFLHPLHSNWLLRTLECASSSFSSCNCTPNNFLLQKSVLDPHVSAPKCLISDSIAYFFWFPDSFSVFLFNIFVVLLALSLGLQIFLPFLSHLQMMLFCTIMLNVWCQWSSDSCSFRLWAMVWFSSTANSSHTFLTPWNHQCSHQSLWLHCLCCMMMSVHSHPSGQQQTPICPMAVMTWNLLRPQLVCRILFCA